MTIWRRREYIIVIPTPSLRDNELGQSPTAASKTMIVHSPMATPSSHLSPPATLPLPPHKDSQSRPETVSGDNIDSHHTSTKPPKIHLTNNSDIPTELSSGSGAVMSAGSGVLPPPSNQAGAKSSAGKNNGGSLIWKNARRQLVRTLVFSRQCIHVIL